VKLRKCSNCSVVNVKIRRYCKYKKEHICRVTMFDEALSIALQYGKDAVGE